MSSGSRPPLSLQMRVADEANNKRHLAIHTDHAETRKHMERCRDCFAGAGMVVTWAVWMFGSAVHYTFLPRCLSRSMVSVVEFAIIQTVLTGVMSSVYRRRPRPKQVSHGQHQEQQKRHETTVVATGGIRAGPACAPHLHAIACEHLDTLVAGAAFAVAITMTNASVAYGSASGSRMVKSLEPAIVAAIQFVAGGMDSGGGDSPWVCLIALAVCMMLAAAPQAVTFVSSAAALLSTAGIATRNVYVKRKMQADGGRSGSAAAAWSAPPQGPASLANVAAAASKPAAMLMTDDGTQERGLTAVTAAATHGPFSRLVGSGSRVDVQTEVNFVACAVLVVLASGWTVVRGWDSSRSVLRTHTSYLSDLVIASGSFAAFQIAALTVLERVTPTRQAAIKSLQNAATTAWVLLVEANGSTLQIVPALVWGVCVVALAMDARMSVETMLGPCMPPTMHRRAGLTHAGNKTRLRRSANDDSASSLQPQLGDVECSVVSSDVATTGLWQHGARGTRQLVWALLYCSCVLALMLQCAWMAQLGWNNTTMLATTASGVDASHE